MPTLVTGDLWSQWGHVSLLLFTSNSITKRDGSLVMGAGSALQAQRHAPTFAQEAGTWLTQTGRVGSIYGLFLTEVAYPMNDSTVVGYQMLGALQTKRHWMEPASLLLIAHSLGRLCQLLESHTEAYPRVAMPFPGIGYGGLPRAEVLPLLEPLPRYVHVYEP